MANSTMAGAPLDTIAHLIGGPRIDDLLYATAARTPQRLAVRWSGGEISYAELDANATHLGAALRAAVGGPDAVIALAMTLSPAFPLGFFGIARADNISALINPLLPDERLVYLLNSCGARAAIVPPELYRRLSAVRDQLPELTLLVPTHRNAEPEPYPDQVLIVDELVERARDEPASATVAAENAVACLQFTSGTTGAPKVIQLTHRNLTVNTAQTAYAHRLTGASVLFNHLPTFHAMHLTIGVSVGATHVLWSSGDLAGAMAAARRYDATHYYSLPVRLSRLATDSRLSEFETPALRAILSGGSALSPAATRTLTEHFGVPVVQGYGLAETSPSIHLGNLDKPKIGSSGQLVPGAECRIVHVDTGAVQPIGNKGEILVRGPQLMKGYLGRDLTQDVDKDGWFHTGDVGYLDDEGYLFVVDRIKDVFKCDNWLVSPTEIEQVVLRHPGVADCVVIDYPDEARGAVAYGLVVLSDDAVKPDELAEFVNGQVPYYERLEHVELVARIPRSPTGKVQRRDLRERVLNKQ